MALQDLTPQLRTRLSRMERAVGWFVFFAVALLLFGFGYYLYTTAARKGWFKTKAPFFTFTERATGLKIGDPILLMGLQVGQVTGLEPMDPESSYNIYIEFELVDPYYGYMWTRGSHVKVTTADLLGKRALEVTKGTSGYPIFMFHPLQEVTLEQARTLPEPQKWKFAEEFYGERGTNLLVRALQPLAATNLDLLATAGIQKFPVFDTHEKGKKITAMWDYQAGRYWPFFSTNKYWLESDESAAVTERLEKLVGQVETALPNILSLTNQLLRVLANGADLTSNLNAVAVSARPAITNLSKATANLDQPGALGEWLVPTNMNRQLEGAIVDARALVRTANTEVAKLAEELATSLENLSGITSNLNQQVQSNTNLIEGLSKTVRDTDDLVQGLKRHWLLRSAFKTKRTNEPPSSIEQPVRSPKDQGSRR